MDPVTPFDWHRIFVGTQPALFYAEIVFRVLVIWLWALLLIRHMGKGGSRNVSPMENLVVIALGSATGDSMLYPEVPLTAAMLIVAMIVGLSRGLAHWQGDSKPVNDFTDGKPLLMLRDGCVIDDALGQARLRKEELYSMLRCDGHRHTRELEYVFMETDGCLSCFTYEDGSTARNGESTWPEDFENQDAVREMAY